MAKIEHNAKRRLRGWVISAQGLTALLSVEITLHKTAHHSQILDSAL